MRPLIDYRWWRWKCFAQNVPDLADPIDLQKRVDRSGCRFLSRNKEAVAERTSNHRLFFIDITNKKRAMTLHKCPYRTSILGLKRDAYAHG